MKTNAFAIASLLAAVGTATVALGQWSLPYALGSVPVQQDKNVTIDFDNAPVSQVFNALKKAGINFVVETTDIPRDKRLSIHINGQPKDKVVEAVAEALGMSWTKKGPIYTLHNGFNGNYRMTLDGKDFNWTPQEAEKWSKEFGKDFGSDWNMKGFDAKGQEEWAKKMADTWKDKGMDEKAMNEWAKAWEKSPEGQFKWKELAPGTKFELKDMPDIEKFVQDHLKNLPEMDKKLQERMMELQKDGKLKEMQSQEIDKVMKEHMSELSKLKDMPDVEKLMKERMKELDKDGKLQDMQKLEIDKIMKEHMSELSKLKDMPDVERLMKERMKDMPKIQEEAMKAKLDALKELKNVKMPDMSKLKVQLANMKKFYDSLTPAQLEKNKSQGYLTLDDLTPAQRELLGTIGKDDNMTMQFDKDGAKVTIKRK